MTLAELITRVREQGAADPLDAVQLSSTPEVGECAARCGLPCGMLIDGLRLHMKCFFDQLAAQPAPEQPPSVPAAEPAVEATPATQSPARPQTRRPAPATPGRRATAKPRLALAAVLDATGLWLPGHAEALAVDQPKSIADLYQLTLDHEVRQLWLHPRLHEPLGLPASRGVKVNPAEAEPHEFTDVDQLQCDPDGLAAWVNVKPAAGPGRRVGIAFPAFETRCAWAAAADGAELLAAVLLLADQLGENYYFSPNETGNALVRHTASTDPDLIGRDDLPEVAGDIVHAHLWSRHLLEEEDDESAWVHRYDLHGAEPAVFGIIWVATGPFRHEVAPTFDRKRDQKRAGYWLLNIPREGHGMDPRLPDLLRPLREADARAETPGGPAWYCTDSVVLLDELGVPFEVVEACVAESSERLLRKTNDQYRTARGGLLEHRAADTPGAQIAYHVLKSVFTSRIGDFSRDGARIYRPDIRDSIIARAAANQYRRLRTVALGKSGEPGSGRFPLAIYSDAIYYVSPDADAWASAPPGLPIGDRTVPGVFGQALGEYDHEASLPLSVVREFAGTRNFNSAFERVRQGKTAQRPRRARKADR